MVTTTLETSSHVLLTVLLPQSMKMRMYLRTTFVNGSCNRLESRLRFSLPILDLLFVVSAQKCIKLGFDLKNCMPLLISTI